MIEYYIVDETIYKVENDRVYRFYNYSGKWGITGRAKYELLRLGGIQLTSLDILMMNIPE